MEGKRMIDSSNKNHHPETFSFPSTPSTDQDRSESEFEFGSITPTSPPTEPYGTSPADHLFSNGRLLPHSFPIQPNHHARLTNSTSSKDAFMSSRSSSTNSRSSCSSARTSSSENSERKAFLHNYQRKYLNKSVAARVYGPSQRWHIITPLRVLSRETSLRKKSETAKEERRMKKLRNNEEKAEATPGFGRRIFRWFLCHAVETSMMRDDMLEGTVFVR